MSKKLASEISSKVKLGRVSSIEVENDLSPLMESLIRGLSESKSFKKEEKLSSNESIRVDSEYVGMLLLKEADEEGGKNPTGDWLNIVELLDSSSKNSKSWEEREPGESKDMKSDPDDMLRWLLGSDDPMRAELRTDLQDDLCSVISCRVLHCLLQTRQTRSPVVSP